MNCCICGNKIQVVGTWKDGNNAQPVKSGRCCDNCNNKIVIPARLSGFYNQDDIFFYFICHTDNLEGIKKDALRCERTAIIKINDKLENLNDGADGELSYTPLYLVDIVTGEIIKYFTEE